MPEFRASSQRTVFKVNTAATGPGAKIMISKNTPEGCAFCQANRKPGDPPLFLCNGCKSARFCNKEHQVAFWPLHKAFCKQQQRSNKALETLNHHSSFHTCGKPPIQERRLILEDWNTLHRYSIVKALASALHVSDQPFHWKTHHVFFELSYRVESDGNPSSAFILDKAYFKENSPAEKAVAHALQAFHPLLENEEKKWIKDPKFVALVPCVFGFDHEFIWLTAHYVYKNDLSPKVVSHERWMEDLKAPLLYGVVYRSVPKNSMWVSGIMNKEDDKWVWEKKTTSQLQAKGIPIVQWPVCSDS
ncbi:hypothetical protein SISNIDRAFT_487333 [Sistotremastrum niveocremeum HHB9708]|uniref:MYND-type domain-containing protein n=1 Tax=Sistotremastrum niveocremeum HHB9708 TaxID=1314777 RepID=A0A164SPE6_9AGAM|nr:hypothetical protein SISNIDRAFT_487333 [Sistotremastrum niveocremeum HHB9708]